MGMFNSLLRKVGARQESTGLDIAKAQRVVQDYRVFLETSAPLPGRVADERQLPHSKEQIKHAISVCISVIRDPQLNEHLKHGYLMLSAWQNGVGHKTWGSISPNSTWTLTQLNWQISSNAKVMS